MGRVVGLTAVLGALAVAILAAAFLVRESTAGLLFITGVSALGAFVAWVVLLIKSRLAREIASSTLGSPTSETTVKYSRSNATGSGSVTIISKTEKK
jgi:hypothetical protein